MCEDLDSIQWLGSCEYGDDVSGFILAGELHHLLTDYQLLKTDFAPWEY
jgi:hypothetical protein